MMEEVRAAAAVFEAESIAPGILMPTGMTCRSRFILQFETCVLIMRLYVKLHLF